MEFDYVYMTNSFYLNSIFHSYQAHFKPQTLYKIKYRKTLLQLGLYMSLISQNNSSWPKTEKPIRWSIISLPCDVAILRRRRGRRLNHSPHHSYIFIFPTRLQVLIKIKKLIPLPCSQQHNKQKIRDNAIRNQLNLSTFLYFNYHLIWNTGTGLCMCLNMC